MRFTPGAVAAIVSVTGHLLLFGALAQRQPPAPSPVATTEKALIVSFYPAAAPKETAPVSPRTNASSSDVTEARQDHREDATMDSAAKPNSPAATAANAAPPAPAALGNVPVLPTEETYLPASQLDSRPSPENPVVIPFPDVPVAKGKVSAILVLFINSDGQVDHIEVDKSDMPPLFEKTAMDAFMQAHMHPGMKNGKAARAKMKVEVEFEAK